LRQKAVLAAWCTSIMLRVTARQGLLYSIHHVQVPTPVVVLCCQVLATDGNEQQLQHAAPAPNVTYQQGDAHSIPLQGCSVDLVTAASALHWFDLPAFYREVRRVLKPHGCMAAWAIPLVRTAQGSHSRGDGVWVSALRGTR
jgi:ubiquinone/menaquinone biosynthesis C-methylase UbiE